MAKRPKYYATVSSACARRTQILGAEDVTYSMAQHHESTAIPALRRRVAFLRFCILFNWLYWPAIRTGIRKAAALSTGNRQTSEPARWVEAVAEKLSGLKVRQAALDAVAEEAR